LQRNLCGEVAQHIPQNRFIGSGHCLLTTQWTFLIYGV